MNVLAPEMDANAPRAGDTVTMFGAGILSQDARVEIRDGARLLLRVTSQSGLAVGLPLEVQYARNGSLFAVEGHLDSRTGNMWWVAIASLSEVQRRQHRRVRVTHKATLLVPNPSGGEDAFLVDLVDVGGGGCAFLFDGRVQAGARVELRFRTLERRVHMRMVVLGTEGTRSGQSHVRGQFVDVPDEDARRLADWLESLPAFSRAA